ncbi:MAG TPA: transaldolase [Acidimicrobiales bacterium]|nr:transaldolase [Acidimicrobiales bacterium]
MSHLTDLYAKGQSPWIDNLRRDWLDDGTLGALVVDGVRGVTSNPSIFAKAFAASSAYDQGAAQLDTTDAEAVYEALTVEDVRDACDVLAAVHASAVADRRAKARRYDDGFVSLEVSPRLARDTAATIDAAHRLSAAVDRPNLMIKIPATAEGLPAITATLADGINVNVTLIFSLERYAEVIDAWAEGLERAAAAGHDLGSLASVASFFVSRVDSAVDALLPEGDPRRGTTAVAQAAAAYRLYRASMAGERAAALLARGAQVQRPLWASTSVKNPAYDALLYVDALVGDETVNTMPDATLAEAAARGGEGPSALATPAATDERAAALDRLDGIDLDAVTAKLEADGVTAFIASYDESLALVASKLDRSA